jgi:ribosomal protein L11 methylase PrmA
MHPAARDAPERRILVLALHAVRRGLASGAAALIALALAGPAPGAQSSVPYVPTPQEVVERMLDMGKVGPHDYLIDLGSGDGRIVVTAARKFGTRGYGVDLNPQRIEEANENARTAGVADKVAFYQRDLFETDLTQATVITMYLTFTANVAGSPMKHVYSGKVSANDITGTVLLSGARVQGEHQWDAAKTQ